MDVLLIAGEIEREERLREALALSGRRVTTLSVAESALLERGDSDGLDLVVTAFEPEDPSSSTVLERLLAGGLFPGVARLYLCPSAALRDSLLARGVDPTRLLLLPDDEARLAMRARLLTEVGGLERRLAEASSLDPLTGLFHRGYLMQRMEEEMSRARRYRTPLSLVLVDIDRLKSINDALGQAAGDAVIRRTGEIIRSQVRREDVMGRIGEDVFGVLSPATVTGAARFSRTR
jgi:PleD family two-component response regulator